MEDLENTIGEFNIDELADEEEEIIDELEEDTIINVDEVYKNIETQEKKTLPILTKYEKARLVGIRKQQLSTGSNPCVSGTFSSIDEIIEEEFKQKRLPLIIRRNLHNGKYEDWRIEELENI